MHAIARPIGIGLGHKAGSKSIFAGDPFYNLFEKSSIISCFHRIMRMHKIDLKLAKTGFADCCISLDHLQLTGSVDFIDQGVIVIDLVNRQDTITDWLGTG